MDTVFHYNLISPLSFVMAVIWFDVFILLSLILKKTGVIIKYSITPLIFMLMLCLLRIIFSIEIPGAIVINSHTIYPALVDFILKPLFTVSWFGIDMNIFNIFLLLWVVVSIILIVRYVVRYRRNNLLINSILINRSERAEKILLEIDPKCEQANAKVYITGAIKIPMIKGNFNPVIILPTTGFSDGELKSILIHEWKHFIDKELLINIIANIICYIFWWNPLVYPWRNSLQLAAEMKCDYNAVVNMSSSDAIDYLNSISKISLDGMELSKLDNQHDPALGLLGNASQLNERLEAMQIYKKPSISSRITKTVFYIIMSLLFISSYMFVVQPRGKIPTENELRIESENEGLFSPTEQYLIKNEDGTYSLYFDGQFIMIIEEGHDVVNNLPIIENY